MLLLLFPSSSFAVDFLSNSFTSNDLIFTGDARVQSSAIRLTANSNVFSMGRAFYPYSILKRTTNTTTIASFSTSFFFSILPESSTSPSFGLAFVISNSTVPVGPLSGQNFVLFINSTIPFVAPLLVVEFDTRQDPEFNDPYSNHIAIDLNSPESNVTHEAGYFNSTTEEFIPIDMCSGSLIQAWIEFDGKELGMNVTIAPAGVSRPSKPLISFYSPVIANFVAPTMFVGFSASKSTWEATQRVLAWSLTDQGVARDINASNLSIFPPESSSNSSLSSSPSLSSVL